VKEAVREEKEAKEGWQRSRSVQTVIPIVDEQEKLVLKKDFQSLISPLAGRSIFLHNL
jgi:hypothetical protein